MRKFLYIIITLIIIPAMVSAEVNMPLVFSNNMVIQRDLPVPVWGTASPGEKISVSFAGQEVKTKAGKDGKWMVKLQPLKMAVKGRTITVKGSKTITFDNVVVGEVWLCGGQSNMGGTLKDHEQELIISKEKEIDLACYRYFNRNEGWLPINGETYNMLSRVSWYYGIKLYEELNKDGMKVPIGVLTIARSGSTIQSWMPQYAAEKIRKELNISKDWNTDKAHHIPGSMFTEQLDMAIPYAIRGAIWYQGESNANYHAWQYQYLLPHLIKTWRSLWADRAGLSLRNFPFYYVQVPPQSKNSHWSRLRDSMRRVLDTTENTGMAVFYDYGPEVHPPLKEPVGTRLALWALAKDYGFDNLVYSGPLLDEVTIKGDKAFLTFTHVGSGLRNKSGGEKLKYFEIAGKDANYVPADACIEGDTVVLHSDKINNPVYVRYLFNRVEDEEKIPEVSLINAEGLPASPFITDDIIPVPIDKEARRMELQRLRKLEKEQEKATN